jgi:hypothetical protein
MIKEFPKKMVRLKGVPVKGEGPAPVPRHHPTAFWVASRGDASDEEPDAEFDDPEQPAEVRHPLENHPALPPSTELQRAIADAIQTGGGGDSASVSAIQLAVAKKKGLRRQDDSEYPSAAHLRQAVVDALRPSAVVPNLFRRDDQGSRSDRQHYRCNTSLQEALESMRAAESANKKPRNR